MGAGDSDEPAANDAAVAPPSLPVAAPQPPVADAERWGDLPVHVRELLRAPGADDMPLRYRDWIEAYYRRMHERR